MSIFGYMDSKEYVIWCDESVKSGKYYSNFYGGVLIQSKDLDIITRELKAVVEEIGITEEIKWQKVDSVKLPAFIRLMNIFFELVKQGKIKIRIMFTQNAHKPKGLTSEHLKSEYFLLYYQFVKHSFGLKYSNKTENKVNLKLFFDDMPDTYSKRQQFKEYIKGLERTKGFIDAGIKIRKEDIVEVNSKKHLPLQLLDVVLGSMQFRLNDLHKEKPLGKRIRGKRTIAKEKLYRHILKKICEMRPNFNIGISTGTINVEDKWLQPYRHWLFIPKEFEIDESEYK